MEINLGYFCIVTLIYALPFLGRFFYISAYMVITRICVLELEVERILIKLYKMKLITPSRQGGQKAS